MAQIFNVVGFGLFVLGFIMYLAVLAKRDTRKAEVVVYGIAVALIMVGIVLMFWGA